MDITPIQNSQPPKKSFDYTFLGSSICFLVGLLLLIYVMNFSAQISAGELPALITISFALIVLSIIVSIFGKHDVRHRVGQSLIMVAGILLILAALFLAYITWATSGIKG
jgi:uncharacterized membrane protein HdeD (DUF308 family)